MFEEMSLISNISKTPNFVNYYRQIEFITNLMINFQNI